ncbi:MerC domain-containing protein [Xanthomonas medicagonis]|uniref:MerC domain-containing protein n=1 Tax=Xanthomonas medicagonis TaxID=3160841 RepID=UPI00351591F9
MKSLPHAVFDASAMVLSGLCLLHCLALPLLAAALPLFGVWAQAEWVHVLFVAIAMPLAGLALWRGHRRDALPWPLWTLAALGLLGLLAGAFGIPDESSETAMTVSGSLALASAHLWNWRRHRQRCHP